MTPESMSHANTVPVSTTRPRPKPDHAAYCAASGCARWSGRWGPHAQFLCGFHWRRLSKIERAAMRRLWRTIEKVDALAGPDSWWQDKVLRRRVNRTWRALVRRASSP